LEGTPRGHLVQPPHDDSCLLALYCLTEPEDCQYQESLLYGTDCEKLLSLSYQLPRQDAPRACPALDLHVKVLR